MPYLGDYLGQILSEIVMARAHVDLETIRVAELYASHPYLKHFPVPHLRLPTITLDLTYAVEHTEEIPAAGSPCGNINVEAMRKSFNAILVTKMARHHLSLNEKTRGKIDAALDDLAQTLKPPPGGAVALRSAAAAMTEAVTTALRESAPKLPKEKAAKLEILSDELTEAAYADFLSLRELPPRVMVLVTKKQLLEIKNPDLLSRLRLTIAEEGQEWTVVDMGGKPRERLVPE